MLENIHACTPSRTVPAATVTTIRPEHGTMWDLHVVAELEVTCELKCLDQGILIP